MLKQIADLKKQGDKLFADKMPLLTFWQDVAENFYPERADFTSQRNLGDEFATNLSTSYPVIARRDLGNAISSMLRPRNQDWFKIGVRNRDIGHDSKRWLERATIIQRRAMYDPDSKFVRATKEGDHDYVAFGQCVISIEMNRKKNSLMYRCWHLRDVAWTEDYDGSICEVFRRSKPSVANLNSEFKGNISEQAKRLLDKDPQCAIEYCHVVLPSDRYSGSKKYAAPYVSIYYEKDTGHVLREEGVQTLIYVIPRWGTISGSQYANSQAVTAALPDARLLQAMTLSLLEAGEMAVNPPLFARQEVFRGDIQRFAGGITYADIEPEQRIDDAISFQPLDPRGLNTGFNMQAGVQEMIAKAFFLDRLTLPQPGPEMTAFETGQRVSEYIRNAIPLFEPMEQDYNAPICEATFDLLLANGAFGPMDEIPDDIRGADIEFEFESPLYEAIEKRKAQTAIEGIQMAAQFEALEPGVSRVIKGKETLSGVLEAIQYPAVWRMGEEELAEAQAAAAQQDELQSTMALLQQGGEAAAAVGEGAAAMQMGGVM